MTAESYPTVIRNTALSFCSVAGRISSTISPYVALLGSVSFEALPYILYSGFAAVSGLLYFFLMPETKDLDLPEDLDDFVGNKPPSTPVKSETDKKEKNDLSTKLSHFK